MVIGVHAEGIDEVLGELAQVAIEQMVGAEGDGDEEDALKVFEDDDEPEKGVAGFGLGGHGVN